MPDPVVPSAAGSGRDLALERELLLGSRLFDESWYASQVGEEAGSDLAGHYLREGWLSDVGPNELFPGNLLRHCFASVGFHEPTAVTWTVLRSSGWPIPSSGEQLEWAASKVLASGLFDESFYRRQAGPIPAELNPAVHYVAVGERLGFAPCGSFDPVFYRERYPDVDQAGLNFLMHYADHGRAEGRSASAPERVARGKAALDPVKDNVLIVVHEASRTGAPILGWNIALQLAGRYNLYVLRFGNGDLISKFEELSVEVLGPFLGASRHPIDLETSLRSFFLDKKFRYAIVNSSESRDIVEICGRRFIPTLLLVHEFAPYVNPIATLRSALDWSTEIIFPARIVAESAEEAHPPLRGRKTHVLPQGSSILPETEGTAESKACPILEDLTQRHEHGTFIVLGAGTVQIRKGVDCFLSTAAAVAKQNIQRPIIFLWVGHGFRPKEDMAYSVYVQEQLCRSGLASSVIFLDEVLDLEPVYRIADAFLLSSRLDPMPNVSLDAAERGIPIICFKNASGTAELLLKDPETALGVVDHLDADAAARVLTELAGDEQLRLRLGAATQRLAHRTFDMRNYVSKLDALGTESTAKMVARKADTETLASDETFDQNMFLGRSDIVETRRDSIIRYLTVSASHRWTRPAAIHEVRRRPCPGFHPELYATGNKSRLNNYIDPLADFVRAGKPPGPWQVAVIKPDHASEQAKPSRQLSAVLHAHFFYPELIHDFLRRLRCNEGACDLLISTDSAEKVKQLEQALDLYDGGRVQLRVFPNKGRDIGPFLTGFAGELNRYDLVGHVHAKRSVDSGDGSFGDSWREFLWQHLLGGKHAMLDRIFAAFKGRDDLGLVFPGDPHIAGWDKNREIAAGLAARMGWTGELPDALDFPLGTMFWIRRQALQPLLQIHLEWHDYPEEPVPYDGTLLHALERLPTLATQLGGLSYAVTHVPGVSW